jgi:hypothetical protein
MNLATFDTAFIIKIFSLIFIGLYAIFVFIVFTNVRSLNKLILVERAAGSKVVVILTFIYLLLTIFLFILAIVIL